MVLYLYSSLLLNGIFAGSYIVLEIWWWKGGWEQIINVLGGIGPLTPIGPLTLTYLPALHGGLIHQKLSYRIHQYLVPNGPDKSMHTAFCTGFGPR